LLNRLRGLVAAEERRPPARASLTTSWFDDARLTAIAARYATYRAPRVGYATVRDFVDSHEHLQPLATAQGDPKDVQRPWTLKAILGTVPRGGRLVEIGAGQPYVADLLARLGYEVWVVDPYDGSGNGPIEYEEFRAACPKVRFLRTRFGDDVSELPAGGVDCVYSISVLEHVDVPGLDAVVRGMQRCLRPRGASIHALDHIDHGRGDEAHLRNLRYLTERLGIDADDLERARSAWKRDTETYYLSAESHNRWRGDLPYDEFPMRVCVSVQTVTPASDLR
jgi:2-polyprenyl-3-methyl-5-hydroxy-6-metoxy-1,4-benzoquinol methylase